MKLSSHFSVHRRTRTLSKFVNITQQHVSNNIMRGTQWSLGPCTERNNHITSHNLTETIGGRIHNLLLKQSVVERLHFVKRTQVTFRQMYHLFSRRWCYYNINRAKMFQTSRQTSSPCLEQYEYMYPLPYCLQHVTECVPWSSMERVRKTFYGLR